MRDGHGGYSGVPGALRREVPLCRTGTQSKVDPASAVHHCVSHRARDTDIGAMTDKFISIEGIAKRYPGANGGAIAVFEDLWLSMARGEFGCVIGHSG